MNLLHKTFWYLGGLTMLFFGSLFLFQITPVSAAPLLANYFLSTLPTDADSIAKLAKNNLLILSPEQALTRTSVINEIKRINPSIILLAYVPSQSYNANWQQYPANTLYGKFVVQNDWWLRDTSGKAISTWAGLTNTNMSTGWSDYLIGYVKDNVLSQGIWDGVFYDMVYDGISWINSGDVDLNSDGVRDNANAADQEWLRRINYLFTKSKEKFNVKYILMNGTSAVAVQSVPNGRMYETFPTPWEAGGSWSGLMTGLARNQSANAKPQLYVFNANTNNTGDKTNYRQVRFGLASSLMVDNVYFSFDFGDQNHAQTWWYDEYDANLGTPIAPAQSQAGKKQFASDVWSRDYTGGIAVVNPTLSEQVVELGADYEKLIGTQDSAVNNGAIVDKVTMPAQDGIILLRTAQVANNIWFGNGTFLRFYKANGQRARNGFFMFEDGLTGGAKIYNGDLDGDGQLEKIVATGPLLEIFNSHGQRWFSGYPFGTAYTGELNLAVGPLEDPTQDNILVSGTGVGQVIKYTYYGAVVKEEFYPFGKKFVGGLSVAIGDLDGDGLGEAILGVGKGLPAEVIAYNSDLSKIKKRYFPFDKKYKGGVNITAGDFTGDARKEVAAVQINTTKPTLRVFDSLGRKLSEFIVSGLFGNQTINLGAFTRSDESRQDIVTVTKN